MTGSSIKIIIVKKVNVFNPNHDGDLAFFIFSLKKRNYSIILILGIKRKAHFMPIL